MFGGALTRVIYLSVLISTLGLACVRDHAIYYYAFWCPTVVPCLGARANFICVVARR